MPLIPPIILVDYSGQQWLLVVSNAAVLGAVPVIGIQSAVPFAYVNSVSDGSTWQISIVGNPPPPGSGLSWGQFQATNVTQSNHPTQLLLTAPNGTVYGLQVATVAPPTLGSTANGIIQIALPSDVTALNCNTPISTLATNVLERLEDPTGIFWSTQFEVYSGLVEAVNDLLLLVGRPTQTVNMQFNLQPNSVWQQMPKGLFAISDIWGPQNRIRKYTLFDYDYTQSGPYGSDWENDISDAGPTSWAPVGLNMFIVHPAPSAPQTVLLDGIAYPVAETNYPYTGAELVPFHHEAFQWLEMYAAHILRLKEGTSEFQESLSLYKGYLDGAKRLTEIEDRRDSMIFSTSFGAPAGVHSHVRR
jgi:hypothetical protein